MYAAVPRWVMDCSQKGSEGEAVPPPRGVLHDVPMDDTRVVRQLKAKKRSDHGEGAIAAGVLICSEVRRNTYTSNEKMPLSAAPLLYEGYPCFKDLHEGHVPAMSRKEATQKLEQGK